MKKGPISRDFAVHVRMRLYLWYHTPCLQNLQQLHHCLQVSIISPHPEHPNTSFRTPDRQQQQQSGQDSSCDSKIGIAPVASGQPETAAVALLLAASAQPPCTVSKHLSSRKRPCRPNVHMYLWHHHLLDRADCCSHCLQRAEGHWHACTKHCTP